jgi:hypothetical protein
MFTYEKYKHYQDVYQPNDMYWGLGVEHETYLETNKLKQVSHKELKEHRQPERYSIHYYDVYDTELLEKTFEDLFPSESASKILLPILCNSHSFVKTDRNGEHPMTADRIPKPNPKCQELILFEWMKLENPDVFSEEFNRTFTFDGDTIEFMTQNYYKTTISHVILELTQIEKNFLRACNSLPREGILKQYAPLSIMKHNYPFASYLTNMKNNAMFNNGTIHINITLPTKLNEKAEIENPELFQKQHQSFARAIQWISPLLVAVYGSPDPLSESKQFGHRYAAGSQRIAVSRYVGLGTYDTNEMKPGAILTKKKEEISHKDWYESFYQKANYKPLDEYGMDINFNKHSRHGLEIRFLDAMILTQLEEVMQFLIHLADCSLENNIVNPTESKRWHDMAERCVHLGKGYQMSVSDQHELFIIFGIHHLSKEPLMVEEVYHIIKHDLQMRYAQGICTTCFRTGEYPSSKKAPIQASSIELSVLSHSTPPLEAIQEEISSSCSLPEQEQKEREEPWQEQNQQNQQPEYDQEQVYAQSPKKKTSCFLCC